MRAQDDQGNCMTTSSLDAFQSFYERYTERMNSMSSHKHFPQFIRITRCFYRIFDNIYTFHYYRRKDPANVLTDPAEFREEEGPPEDNTHYRIFKPCGERTHFAALNTAIDATYMLEYIISSFDSPHYSRVPFKELLGGFDNQYIYYDGPDSLDENPSVIRNGYHSSAVLLMEGLLRQSRAVIFSSVLNPTQTPLKASKHL